MKNFDFYLDQKSTIWYRTNFSVEAETEEEAKQKAIEMVKSNAVAEIPWECMEDTIELMDVSENDNQCTEDLLYGTDSFWNNTIVEV